MQETPKCASHPPPPPPAEAEGEIDAAPVGVVLIPGDGDGPDEGAGDGTGDTEGTTEGVTDGSTVGVGVGVGKSPMTSVIPETPVMTSAPSSVTSEGESEAFFQSIETKLPRDSCKARKRIVANVKLPVVESPRSP